MVLMIKVLLSVMIAHAADVASRILQNVHLITVLCLL